MFSDKACAILPLLDYRFVMSIQDASENDSCKIISDSEFDSGVQGDIILSLNVYKFYYKHGRKVFKSFECSTFTGYGYLVVKK